MFLLLIDAHGAIHFNSHDPVYTVCVDVQIQAQDYSISWRGHDLHICQCPFLQAQLRDKEGGERRLI